GFDSDHPALEAAITLAKRFGAQIECLHVRLDPENALVLMTREASWKIERKEGQLSQKARAVFEEALKRHDLATDGVGAVLKGVAMKWHEVEGFPLPEAVYHGRMNDLIVIARDADGQAGACGARQAGPNDRRDHRGCVERHTGIRACFDGGHAVSAQGAKG